VDLAAPGTRRDTPGLHEFLEPVEVTVDSAFEESDVRPDRLDALPPYVSNGLGRDAAPRDVPEGAAAQSIKPGRPPAKACRRGSPDSDWNRPAIGGHDDEEVWMMLELIMVGVHREEDHHPVR
jgi:hypothetical protein